MNVLSSHLILQFYHLLFLVCPRPVCPSSDTSDLSGKSTERCPLSLSLWPLAVFDHWLSYSRLRDS